MISRWIFGSPAWMKTISTSVALPMNGSVVRKEPVR